jgi:hypothetical protein
MATLMDGQTSTAVTLARMITRAILTLVLLLPVAARGEDMFKWRDARGRVHYSNDTEKVPAGAALVTRKVGEIGGEPIGPALAAPEEPSRAPAAPRPAPRWSPDRSCVRELGLFALPNQSVDFDRRWWFDVDDTCGKQQDVEGWLRDASTTLELRKIGL